jgi:hypothetical protein
MKKIYIVTAGCSFTQSGHKLYNISKNKRTDTTFTSNNLSSVGNVIKYIDYLIYELNDNNIDVEIHNIAEGSIGNHIIFHLYKEKINELLSLGINPHQIYSTIQLTSIARPTICLLDSEYLKKIPNYEYDYIDNIHNLKTYNTLLVNHIDNIENIINFNLINKIENFKLFFGWATYFKDELINADLYEKLKSFNKHLLYIKYSDKPDILNKNPTTRLKLISIFKDSIQLKVVKGDEFGGMTEMCREYTNYDDYFYCSYDDSHLNGLGNYIFYSNFYRNLFVEWNILDIENKIEKKEDTFNILKAYFQSQKLIFKKSENVDIKNEIVKIQLTDEIRNTIFKEIIETQKLIRIEMDKINEQKYIDKYFPSQKQSKSII